MSLALAAWVAWGVAVWVAWAAWATWACNFSAKHAAGGGANPGRAKALSVGFAPCQRRVARKNPLTPISVGGQPKTKNPQGASSAGFFMGLTYLNQPKISTFWLALEVFALC